MANGLLVGEVLLCAHDLLYGLDTKVGAFNLLCEYASLQFVTGSCSFWALLVERGLFALPLRAIRLRS